MMKTMPMNGSDDFSACFDPMDLGAFDSACRLKEMKPRKRMVESARPVVTTRALMSEKPKDVASGYFMFTLCTVIVSRAFSDCGYSAILTLGVGLQCLGFYMLLVKVRQQGSVAGISAKTIEVYALVLLFRLAATLVRSGYLPVDRSGDFVYQLADIISLVSVCRLLQCMRTMRGTYQEEFDTFDLKFAVPACVVLAIFIHGNLNDHWFFDTVWTISMNLDTVAMIPQLWMLSKMGGEVEGMTSHFVVAIMLSRACAFSFWVYGYKELKRHASLPNVAGWQLLAAHALQVLICIDFFYYYTIARIKGRRMKLPVAI